MIFGYNFPFVDCLWCDAQQTADKRETANRFDGLFAGNRSRIVGKWFRIVSHMNSMARLQIRRQLEKICSSAFAPHHFLTTDSGG
jgi:hypothetical protein